MLNRRSFLASSAAAIGAAAFASRQAFGQGGASEVHIGIFEDPQTLDPANHRSRTTETVIRNMTDGLLTRDPDMKLVPEIATSWTKIDDKTWEFALQQGIKFHSGDVLTADDIVFTFNRLVQKDAMGGQTSPRKGLLAAVTETTKVDDHTVRMHLSEPWQFLLDYMPVQEVVNKRYVEEVGQEAMQTSIDGCGPFKLNAWRRGEAVIMDRFAEYWGGSPAIPPVGPAQVDRLVFRTVPDASARLAGLLSGELDIVTDLTANHVAAVDGSDRAQIMRVAGSTHFYVGMNIHKAPFNDVRVRRALNLAIDRAQIIERVMDGNATPLRGIMAPEDEGYDASLPELAYDIEQAKALLAEAGVKPGTEFTMDVIEARKEQAEIICSFLSRLGIVVRPQVMETSVLNPTWRDPATREARDFIYSSMGNSSLTTEILPSALGTGGGLNMVGYSDPVMDELIGKLNSTSGDEYLQVARDIQQKAAAELPFLFLWVPIDLYGVSKRIEGWRPRSDSRINLHRVRIIG